jgi:hypothetical protein
MIPNAASPLASHQAVIKTATDYVSKNLRIRSGIAKIVEGILLKCNEYASSVDILVQFHPGISILVWGSIRILISVNALPKQLDIHKISQVLGGCGGD